MDTWTQRTSSIIAVIVVLAIVALLALARPVPPELWSFGSIVIGFFFGVQSGFAGARAR